jgi:hypothetical protein
MGLWISCPTAEALTLAQTGGTRLGLFHMTGLSARIPAPARGRRSLAASPSRRSQRALGVHVPNPLAQAVECLGVVDASPPVETERKRRQRAARSRGSAAHTAGQAADKKPRPEGDTGRGPQRAGDRGGAIRALVLQRTRNPPSGQLIKMDSLKPCTEKAPPIRAGRMARRLLGAVLRAYLIRGMYASQSPIAAEQAKAAITASHASGSRRCSSRSARAWQRPCCVYDDARQRGISLTWML